MIKIMDKWEFEEKKDDYITLGNWVGLTEGKPPSKVIREAVKVITESLKRKEFFKSFKKKEIIVKTDIPVEIQYEGYPCTVGVKIKCKYRGYNGYMKAQIAKLLPLVEGEIPAEMKWVKNNAKKVQKQG